MASSASKAMTDVLLCDLGGVFFDISFERAINVWRELGFSQKEELTVGSVLTKEFFAFEAGKLDEQDFLAMLERSIGWFGPRELMVEGWNSIYGSVNADVVRFLLDLRGAGWTLIGVSNTNPIHEPVWRARFGGALSVFDRVVTSIEADSSKPSREFFDYTLSSQPNARPVLLDDRLEIVNEARNVNVAAFHYDGPERLSRLSVKLLKREDFTCASWLESQLD
ncbi:hypothetical protein [Nonomuraea sp. B19D2]|uniref:hypothetical protein n=1 Tax=Nonomuraea sp. B19D2 TaxID=3159561 RepID=UPI0032DACB56